ncbi:MAG: pyridoxal phosphate-dependent aminotransferase [Nitrosomonadales bacterium]
MPSNKFISKTSSRIKESPTLAVTAKANYLKSQGIDIVGLAAGEPDFDTPNFIKDAAKKAIDEGKTKYTAVGGIPSLKKAIVNKFKRDNDLSYTEKEIVVGVGGKQCIFNLCLAVLNSDDEVIIPSPYWVSYEDIALVADAKPIIIQTSFQDKFKITVTQLEQSITNKTKLIFLNSPSNPTGSVYSKSELEAIANVLLKHPNILVASDDIYEHINLNGNPFYNILMVEPKLKDRCVILNGVSKAYSMTGWRIGYAAGPEEIILAMTNLQSQSTSNPCSISQAAAEAALNGDQDCIKVMTAEFKKRHDFILTELNKINGLKCVSADGAFYVFPYAYDAIQKLFQQKLIKEPTDIALCEYFIEKANVAVVPGSAFGAPNYFRISFATSLENLKKAVDRIKFALSK